MDAKTSPARAADCPDTRLDPSLARPVRGRGAGQQMLARFGLIAESVHPGGLTSMALEFDDPSDPREPKGRDAAWATRRIL